MYDLLVSLFSSRSKTQSGKLMQGYILNHIKLVKFVLQFFVLLKKQKTVLINADGNSNLSLLGECTV